MHQFLFGPVNSRRLGRSLGIDLLPFKTCSLDCIYCECGFTTHQTMDRAEFVPTADVIAELDAYFATDPDIDAVTFSGSGEPTLHTGIGIIIEYLKTSHRQFRVAVLTNGTLLGDPVVQAELARADLVVPSLDGATDDAFQAICRPAAGVSVQSVIDGIASFRRSFSGLLLLEIFIVPGLNDGSEALAALKRAATSIMPDAIQLNSLDRPAPDPGVRALGPEGLQVIRDSFKPLQVQLVRQRGKDEPVPWSDAVVQQEILSVLEGTPSTLERLSLATGIRQGDLAKTLARMSDQALIHYDQANNAIRRRR